MAPGFLPNVEFGKSRMSSGYAGVVGAEHSIHGTLLRDSNVAKMWSRSLASYTRNSLRACEWFYLWSCCCDAAEERKQSEIREGRGI